MFLCLAYFTERHVFGVYLRCSMCGSQLAFLMTGVPSLVLGPPLALHPRWAVNPGLSFGGEGCARFTSVLYTWFWHLQFKKTAGV